LHAVSFPILDINANAIAAITVPMLARIDGTKQVSHAKAIEELRKMATVLTSRIALTGYKKIKKK
jgi:DNA-binding IclR family transcriptional regulator